MSIGNDATSEGYPLVHSSGSDDAKVKWGARELNRTRDFVAQVKKLIPAIWPVNRGGTGANNKANARVNLGITYGTGNPTGGADGDIHFKIIS